MLYEWLTISSEKTKGFKAAKMCFYRWLLRIPLTKHVSKDKLLDKMKTKYKVITMK